MKDDQGNIKPDAYNNVKPENAVDGNISTSFTSYQGDNQWLTVDLGQAYTVGRIVVDWTSDAGKIYDVLVSSDNKTGQLFIVYLRDMLTLQIISLYIRQV